MIRQAHTYLAGAVSGTALIAAAVVAFVMLVSIQALRDWPLAGISLGGDDNAASAPSSTGGTPASQAGQASGGPSAGAAGSAAGSRSSGPAEDRAAGTQGTRVATGAAPTAAADSPVAESPTSNPATPGAANGSSPSGSANTGSRDGGSGSGSNGPLNGGPVGSVTQSPSGAATGTVNNTVSGVDEATGGVVGSTGVTKVTEEAVNNVAGPESAVGQTVDETVKSVGGLLGK